MAGAARLLMLLTTPFPILHHSCPSLLRLSRRHYLLSPSLSSISRFHLITCSPSNSRRPLITKVKSCQEFHNEASSALRTDHFSDSGYSPAPPVSHPWPEWFRFIENLSAGGYFNNQSGLDATGWGHEIGGQDGFVAVGDLPEGFVREANACLEFARCRPNLLRLLSRKDIEVVILHGTPFLFKNADETVRRMKSFLGDGGTNTSTIDLMRFILSYASNLLASPERNNLYNKDLVELSVRNLLGDLAKLSYVAPGSSQYGSMQNQSPGRFSQTARPLGQKIEMKRGDWICPRCSFMNFARNIKCLECEEPRPKRQLTGGEWECPQCDFFNYGRNLICLRCDCKRPGESLCSTNNMSGMNYGSEFNTSKSDVDARLAANEEKAQRWFSKVSQLEGTLDISSAVADDDFPEIMPLRKGVNRFVVSTRKTPLERRLANAQYRKNVGNSNSAEGHDHKTAEFNQSYDASISQNLDQILGRPSGSPSDVRSVSAAGQSIRSDGLSSISSSSSLHGPSKGSESGYVPFVPLPADMFAKKSENLKNEEGQKAAFGGNIASNTPHGTSSPSKLDENANSGDASQLSMNQIESLDKEKEQAEKSERWFKKVAELHNVSDLTSAISDEDFPEIMPMRKGENRFVVGKKKDRSLTSPSYKRQLAIDQANKNDFVPFVPFPPGYFAKKDDQQPDEANSNNEAVFKSSSTPENQENSDDAGTWLQGRNNLQGMQNHHISQRSGTPKPAERTIDNDMNGTYRMSTQGNLSHGYNDSQIDNKENSSPVGGITKQTPFSGSSSSSSENQSIGERWTGKSLEGSAVKEPDPLDMSEEAKAQRWFRRVAQIKDISELSQIPDEDFPSIMPMRKGVNRFVVSKRKTPLERRLTSQQYRKNLPLNSDPIKRENEDT